MVLARRILWLSLSLAAAVPGWVPAQQSDRDDDQRARVVYTSVPLEVRPGGSVEAALRVYNDWGGGPETQIPATVMNAMYEAAGGGDKAFKAIALLIDKGLDKKSLKDPAGIKKTKIANEHSVQMAQLREKWIDEVIVGILESKQGEWKIARSDSGNVTSGMKSDLDQTFYVLKKDASGNWVRDFDADKQFIELFESGFSGKEGVPSLAALDIASIEGKNRFPDPRDVSLDFRETYLETIDALRNTPGAYTYSGAVAQQMQFRSLEAILGGNKRAYQQYGPGPDGKMKKLPFDPDAALRTMFGITPALIPGHAFGASVANYLELVKYVKKPKFETKYHLRTFDDGGLVFEMDKKSRLAKVEYMALTKVDREKANKRVVDSMFTDPTKRKLHRLALDASADLRWLHKGDAEKVFGADDPKTPEAREAKVFDALAREMFDVPDDAKPTPEQVKAASMEHRKLAVEFCLETTFRTATEAFKTYNDLRFKSIGSLDGYRHIMTDVKPADWPKVRENMRSAQRITLLYSLYDLGAWKSAEMIGRLQRQFPDLGWKEAAGLWLRGRVQGLEAPLRNPKLRRIYAVQLKRGVRALHGRVQQHIKAELGFVNVVKAEAGVTRVLKIGKLNWSPAQFAKSMAWDPGSIDALAQIVRAYVTSEGDMERVKAVATDEFILAIPVAGQLVSASRGGAQGLVLMAGAIQFPMLGAALLVYSVGDAGYAIYDTEYGRHVKNNLADAIYRGYTGPDTRAYDSPPVQFTAKDVTRLEILRNRLKYAKEQGDAALEKKVTAEIGVLETRQAQWKAFRDGSWHGGYFTQWGSMNEHHSIGNSLLAQIEPIISFSPAGLIDFRAKFDPARDGARIEALRKKMDAAKEAETYLHAADELDELTVQRDRHARAQRYLARATGRGSDTTEMTAREKRLGVPELLHKLRRDSLYPAMLELAKKAQATEGKTAQPNPDRWVEQWASANGDRAIARLVEVRLLPRSALDKVHVGNFAARKKASPLPIRALKDRLTTDYERSRQLYRAFLDLEKKRREQRRVRLATRLAAYDAQAAGMYVEELAGDKRLRELAIAQYLASRKRNAPTVRADFYVIRSEEDGKPSAQVELHAMTRVTADPALYVGPYNTVVKRLTRKSAERAISTGRIDDVELLPPVRDALRAQVAALPPPPSDPKEAENAPPVIIPVATVYATKVADMSAALPGTFEHLPGLKRTKHGHLMGQVAGATVGTAEEKPEPAPTSIASSPGTRVRMAVRKPDGDSRMARLRARRGPPTWEDPTSENARATESSQRLYDGTVGAPHVWTTWADRPEKARFSYRIRAHGGIPPFDSTKEGRLHLSRKKEITGTQLTGDVASITIPIPDHTAGRIEVEGEVFAHTGRGKGEPIARHAFNTGVTYAPAPLECTGTSHRGHDATVSAGIRIKGAQRGSRVAAVQVGGVTRYGIFNGTSVSVKLPNASPTPKTATVEFRNFGRDEKLTVDLVAKERKLKPIREDLIERYEADVTKRKASKDAPAYLRDIFGKYRMMSDLCHKHDPSRSAKYAQLALDTGDKLLEAAANPKWPGFNNPDLRHDGMLLQSWMRRGADQGNAVHRKLQARLRYDVIRGLLDRAKDLAYVGAFDTAQRLAARAGELFRGLDNDIMRGNLIYDFETAHSRLASEVFRRTGDFGQCQAEQDRGNAYRKLGCELKKKYRPSKPPFRPDPDFADG